MKMTETLAVVPNSGFEIALLIAMILCLCTYVFYLKCVNATLENQQQQKNLRQKSQEFEETLEIIKELTNRVESCEIESNLSHNLIISKNGYITELEDKLAGQLEHTREKAPFFLITSSGEQKQLVTFLLEKSSIVKLEKKSLLDGVKIARATLLRSIVNDFVNRS